MTDYADTRLHQWARWALRGSGPTGLPHETILHRVMRDGALIRGTGQRPEPEDRQEHNTEKALMAMRDRMPEEYRAVVHYYLGRGTATQKAKDLGVSRRLFFNQLENGRAWVESWLVATEAVV